MMRELKFMFRDKPVLVWLSSALLFSAFAIALGLSEVNQQNAEIMDLLQLDQVERETTLAKQSNWGSAAYYTFHTTYNPPSNFAFAALGQRDLIPWKHRIRMLALEGQIYETDANNPDFALIGRFDYAFVVSIIAPLLVTLKGVTAHQHSTCYAMFARARSWTESRYTKNFTCSVLHRCLSLFTIMDDSDAMVNPRPTNRII